MKKLFLLFLPVVLIISTCEKKDDGPNPNDIINIPDTAFLSALITEGVDTDGDGKISYAEAEAVLKIDFGNDRGNHNWPGQGFKIESLVGIEAFTNLTFLNCRGNFISSLNVSNNTSLTLLHCCGNNLTDLDVSKNTSLLSLECAGNKLTTLDISNNTNLIDFNCNRNLLTNLDVSRNTRLEGIDISYMPNLEKVCVWTTPFPINNISVWWESSPNVYFTTDCGK
ncbi:hypothetical protein ACFLR8_00040 [Bacteroidota bacterium]